MRTIITLTTVVALLLHLWLGCCAHHGHAAEAANCISDFSGASSVTEGSDSCCPCDCPTTCGDSPPPENNESHLDNDAPASPCPGKPDQCPDSQCVFLSVAKSLNSDHVVDEATSLVASAAILESGSLLATGDLFDGESLPPLRRHLLYQILVI